MHAVISGAGISGLATATGLAGSGWRVTMVEAAPAPRRGGYMIDFFGPGWAAAERLGVMPALRRRGRIYTAARYVDRDGHTTGRLPLASLAGVTGGRYFSVLRPEIEEALRESLPPTVDVRYGRTVTAVEQRGAPQPGRGHARRRQHPHRRPRRRRGRPALGRAAARGRRRGGPAAPAGVPDRGVHLLPSGAGGPSG